MADTRSDCFGCWVHTWPRGARPVPEPVWKLGEGWTLNHRELGQIRRPSWVLQSFRHIPTLSRASNEEQMEFGQALAQSMSAAGAACEAPRMFLQLTNQSRGHFHLDLVPWWEGDTSSDPANLVLQDAPPGVIRKPTEELMDLVAQSLQLGPLPIERV